MRPFYSIEASRYLRFSTFQLKDEPGGDTGIAGTNQGLLSRICCRRFDFGNEGLVVEAVEMWKSRSDFQGRWEERETSFWFSSLSTARHFHGRFRPVRQDAPPDKNCEIEFVWPFACDAPTRCR